MKRRVLSLLLAILMVAALLPTSAVAAGTGKTVNVKETVKVDGKSVNVQLNKVPDGTKLKLSEPKRSGYSKAVSAAVGGEYETLFAVKAGVSPSLKKAVKVTVTAAALKGLKAADVRLFRVTDGQAKEIRSFDISGKDLIVKIKTLGLLVAVKAAPAETPAEEPAEEPAEDEHAEVPSEEAPAEESAEAAAADPAEQETAVAVNPANSDPVTSGTCGDNLTWEFFEDGVLVISGTGDMYDYKIADPYSSPWQRLAAQIYAVVIKEGVTSIGKDAFSHQEYYTRLNIVELPSTLKVIGDNAFMYVPTLTRVYVAGGAAPAGVLKLPEGLTAIGKNAFDGCNFKEVALPSTLTSLGEGAFSSCRKLRTVYVNGGDYIPDTCILPAGLTTVNASFGLSGFKTVIVPADAVMVGGFPSGVTTLYPAGGQAIPGTCIYPDSATEIGGASYCAFEKIVFPAGLTSLRGQQFSYAQNLTTVDLSKASGLTAFSEYSFYYCRTLQKVILPDNVTSITRDNTCPKLSFICNYGTTTWNTLSAMTGVTFYGKMPDGTILDSGGKRPITECTVSLSPEVIYITEGQEMEKPAVTITDGDITLAQGTDYTVSYERYGYNSDDYAVVYTGIGNYSGTGMVTYGAFLRNKLTIEQKDITLTAPYNGEIIWTIKASALSNDIRYITDSSVVKVSEKGKVAIPAGFSGTVHITVIAGQPGFNGYEEVSGDVIITVEPYTVLPNQLNIYKKDIRIDASPAEEKKVAITADYLYGPIHFTSDTPEVPVSEDGVLTVPAAFVGTVAVTVTVGDGAEYEVLTDTVTVSVEKIEHTIKCKDVYKTYGKTEQTVTLTVNHTGSGKPVFSSDSDRITVDDQGVVTIPAEFYGMAHITVSLPGEGVYNDTSVIVCVYAGTAKTTLSSLTAGKNSVSVKWKKVSGAAGYEIQYSALKDFSRAKTVTVAKGSTVSKTVKKLTKGVTYYFRVRSYRMAAGVKTYSAWTSAKSIRVTNGSDAPSLDKITGLKIKPQLNWSAVTASVTAQWARSDKAEEYEISYRYMSASGKWTSWKTVSAGTETLKKISVKHGFKYSFRVRGMKRQADGTPIYSPWSSAKTTTAFFTPEVYTYCYTDNSNRYSIPVVIQNTGVVPMTINKKATFTELNNPNLKNYPLVMYATDKINAPQEATSITLAPGKAAVIYYKAKNNDVDFFLDRNTVIRISFTCDGQEYYAWAYSQDYVDTDI